MHCANSCSLKVGWDYLAFPRALDHWYRLVLSVCLFLFVPGYTGFFLIPFHPLLPPPTAHPVSQNAFGGMIKKIKSKGKGRVTLGRDERGKIAIFMDLGKVFCLFVFTFHASRIPE